jgi:hypothetical protein
VADTIGQRENGFGEDDGEWENQSAQPTPPAGGVMTPDGFQEGTSDYENKDSGKQDQESNMIRGEPDPFREMDQQNLASQLPQPQTPPYPSPGSYPQGLTPNGYYGNPNSYQSPMPPTTHVDPVQQSQQTMGAMNQMVNTIGSMVRQQQSASGASNPVNNLQMNQINAGGGYAQPSSGGGINLLNQQAQGTRSGTSQHQTSWTPTVRRRK